jgi:hypothetical protein
MDSIITELAPSFDIVKHELRFFSAQTLDEISDSLRPAELVNTVMDYRYRIDRALDFVERIVSEERVLSGILGSARKWIERLALVAVVGVFAVWMGERFAGNDRGIFNTNVGFILVAVGGVFLLAVLRQTRKLPDTGTQGRRRRKLKRRRTARPRNGLAPQPTIPAQTNGSATQGSGRPASQRPR